MRPPHSFTALMVALCLGACATTAPRLGSSPTYVQVDVGSELRFEPLRPEELGNPAFRTVIEQCELQKHSNCRRRIVGIETQTTFARPREAQVITLVSASGLEASRRYEVHWRLFDPKREMRARLASVWDSPRDWPPTFLIQWHFMWSPSNRLNWELGR